MTHEPFAPLPLLDEVLAHPLPDLEPQTPARQRFSAVVLSAGTGSRLRPLTDTLCKPLVPVLNVPVLYWAIGMLRSAGAQQFALNAHYRSEQIVAAAARLRERHDTPVTVVREDRLSGPVGGILACRDRLAPAACQVVVSGDAITDLDLRSLVDEHLADGADLTIVAQPVTEPGRYGVLRLDGRDVVGMDEKPGDDAVAGSVVNCGIYAFSDRALRALRPPPGAQDGYDVKHLVPQFLAAGLRVRAHVTDAYWCDVGTPESYLQANLHQLDGDAPGQVARAARAGLWTQSAHETYDGVDVEGRVLIGAGAQVGAGSVLDRVIVGPGARIGPGAHLRDAVVLPGAVVPAGVTLRGQLAA